MSDFTTLPGTNIPCGKGEDSRRMLDGLFSAGGLVLSQVSALTELKGYMVQNWVSRGYLTAPQNKKYSKEQFCRIVTINLLKDSLSLAEITALLSYINGRLDDDSDDRIDDTDLYIYFTEALRRSDGTPEGARAAAKEIIPKEQFPPNTVERLEDVLTIMCVAYNSSKLLQTAKSLVAALPAPLKVK